MSSTRKPRLYGLIRKWIVRRRLQRILSAWRNVDSKEWRFGEGNEKSLFVTGFVLDKIGLAENNSLNGEIPADWFKLAGWEIGRQNVPESLWRTLVADRGPDGKNTKVYYAKALEFAVKYSTPENGLETADLSKRQNPILVEFLDRMKAVVYNRKLFKSERDNCLGLAPKRAKEGDFVLRQFTHTDGYHYQFMGECYVHTMMDGKAIDVQELKDLKTVMFELR
ncbi:hypothetical protein LTR85_010804 [Meristemomyces frigidus]|nr:hypothetical protein LTR85_010804 [Meristemomyces frigidus]